LNGNCRRREQNKRGIIFNGKMAEKFPDLKGKKPEI
jgi:hypothetical protein